MLIQQELWDYDLAQQRHYELIEAAKHARLADMAQRHQSQTHPQWAASLLPRLWIPVFTPLRGANVEESYEPRSVDL